MEIFYDIFACSNRGVRRTAYGGTATASVARSGVYDATQLLVDPSATLADFADRLRERGIFLEQGPMVGIIPVNL